MKVIKNIDYLKRVKSLNKNITGCDVASDNKCNNIIIPSPNNPNIPPIPSDDSCCLIIENLISDVTVGSIDAGDIIERGTTLTEFIKQLLIKTFYPTFVEPVYSLSTDKTLEIIGDTIDFILVFNGTRGSILGKKIENIWQPDQFQNYLLGEFIEFNFYDENNDLIISDDSSVISVSNYVVDEGYNVFKANTEYLQGSQPIDSKGNNYNLPIPAGVSLLQLTQFEGVYPIFASTVSILVATQQLLYSMITANNIELTLVAETIGNKQFFEIPDIWLSLRPITKIEYFNIVTNSFDPTNKLVDFIQSNTSKTIFGNVINYIKFTNTSLLRGIIKIKLVF